MTEPSENLEQAATRLQRAVAQREALGDALNLLGDLFRTALDEVDAARAEVKTFEKGATA